ncbi:MAG: hypothetical protein MI921_03220 [Cytophagales bacterium]|nr:hypothetical protein [Cytophagales bacterium]
MRKIQEYEGYVAFLDIIGFAGMIKSRPLSEVIQKIETGLFMSRLAGNLGEGMPNTSGMDLFDKKFDPLNFFSFSDTFVLSTRSLEIRYLFQILAGTAILSQYLISGGLPVRGAISKGELAKISGTDHLIGKGIINAAELEKQQEWFGIAVDPKLVDNEFIELCKNPLLHPLAIRYDVPVKETYNGEKVEWAINWRFNLWVNNGLKSLFPDPVSDRDVKLENTMKFCKHVRSNSFHKGTLHDETGKEIVVGWKRGMWIGPYPPDDPRSVKLDE